MHAIMKHWHPMIGRDMHIPWPPGSPSPAPSPVPYVTTHMLFGTGGLTAVYDATHQTQGMGFTMNVGTDIGPLIPHFGAPSNLLPIEVPLSASTSHFGPANYLAGGKPVAAGLLGNTNLNLNCGTPLPLPVGQVIVLNTHYVSMSLADIAGGAAAMAAGVAVGVVLGKISGAAGSRLGNYLTRKFSQSVFNRTFLRLSLKNHKWAMTTAHMRQWNWDTYAPAWIDAGFGAAASFFGGGPGGADIGTFTDAPTPGGWLGDEATGGAREGASQAVDDYLNDPGVEEFPSGG